MSMSPTFLAFHTASRALAASQANIDVTGNNIANVGTAGFKSSRATFSDLISSSLGGGSGSDQIGLGVFLNDVQTNFSQGSMTTTDNTFDLAIDGNGFYLVRNTSGANFYSRAGQFKVDSVGQVVDSSGALLQGYQADTNGNITTRCFAQTEVPGANTRVVAPSPRSGTAR